MLFFIGFAKVDSIEYTVADSNIINTAYAGGAGENENRIILAVGNGVYGFDRFEGFVDCGKG